MGIAEQLIKVREELPEGVTLVAVSKFHPEADVLEAYNAGQRIFGENIAQEVRRKHENLPADIQWHFIGHLQKNKIKYIAPFVAMIHSVDSFELLQEINRHAEKCSRTIPCLLQIHVAREETKFGFSFEECRQMLLEGKWKQLNHIHLSGLMCMASNIDDDTQILKEFNSVNHFFQEIKQQFFADDPLFCQRSFGMSGDYGLAIQAGSTMVRIGSLIFGARPSKD